MLNKRENKIYIKIAVAAVIIQLLFFKYWYPFAGFINGDSYTYIRSAFFNDDINIYPIGYSKFLRLFSVFSSSDTILVIAQYLLLQFSILSFLFSIFHIFNPSNFIKKSLFGLMIFNPILLYLANYISSDTLFLSLSLIWFNLLLCILIQPSFILIAVHSLTLFLLFTIRYNAVIYPIISFIVFIYNKNYLILKTFGILFSTILIVSFINFNREKYYEQTGIKQFTPFSGWQLANNAMYAYKFVDKKDTINVPKKFRVLDKIVRDYFDSTKNNINHPEEKWKASTVYMWTQIAPLRRYLNQTHNISQKEYASFKDWASMGQFYNEYGKYIICHYPWAFVKYYLYPNAIKYYSPPLEYLQNYSTGVDSVAYEAKIWFNYKSNKINTIFKDFRVDILNFYPTLIGLTNILFVLTLCIFIILRRYEKNRILSGSIIIVFFLWIFNLLFSIFAAPIALRFQLFPNLIITCFSVLLFDFIIKEGKIRH